TDGVDVGDLRRHQDRNTLARLGEQGQIDVDVGAFFRLDAAEHVGELARRAIDRLRCEQLSAACERRRRRGGDESEETASTPRHDRLPACLDTTHDLYTT